MIDTVLWELLGSTMAIHAHFTVVDFIVFSLTLLASMGIGIFYSRAGGAQQNNNEYLMAGRSMSSIPVAISVLASFVSSIAILGNPAEVYTYGFQYWIQSFTNFVSVPMMAIVFLPVYYNLRLTSSYEVGRRDIHLKFTLTPTKLQTTGHGKVTCTVYSGTPPYHLVITTTLFWPKQSSVNFFI